MDRQPAERFQDLIVWQKSHPLTRRVYRLTKTFPKEELFGLTSQMRRASVSVAANFAEGFSKRSRPDKARLMNISQGSLEELRYYSSCQPTSVTWPPKKDGPISTRARDCSEPMSGLSSHAPAPSS
jgi:four helix bundle protein